MDAPMDAVLALLSGAASVAAAAAEPAHGTAPGLPQLAVDTFASQLFWLAVTFGFLFWMLSTVAIPRIASVIEERRTRIAADLDSAQALKGEAEAIIKAYEQALADARAKARAEVEATRRQVASELEAQRLAAEEALAAKVQAAESRIAAARDKAMLQVKAMAATAATDVVAKLTGEQVTPAETAAAVDAASARKED